MSAGGTPQSGIFALGTRTHYYLELDLRPGADPGAVVAVAADLREPHATTGGANLVLAFRPSLWVAAGGEGPEDGADFRSIEGPEGFVMPATQHDVWVWASGAGYDVVFDTVRTVAVAFSDLATVASEHHGFTYRDSRDLTGFVDGTENPPVSEAPLVATVPEGRPGAGGSVVLVQHWDHDLGAFHELPEEAQEQVFGRTKADSRELEGDAKPPDAHVARVVIEDEAGDELEIFRRSTSIATMGAQGLLFVAFSADRSRIDRMLERMAGVEGPRDRLTRYSTPRSGAYYFAPSIQAMS